MSAQDWGGTIGLPHLKHPSRASGFVLGREAVDVCLLDAPSKFFFTIQRREALRAVCNKTDSATRRAPCCIVATSFHYFNGGAKWERKTPICRSESKMKINAPL
jgi:hypothetical protein